MNRHAFAFATCILLSSLLPQSHATAAPMLSHGTSIQGALAYQDDADPTQFHYQPLFSEAVLGDRLKTFRVSHFGVGKQFLVKHSDGSITSVAGAVVSGTLSIDISSSQRQALLAQITKDFGVQNPKLLPLRLTNPKIESIVLDKVIGFGDTVQQSLPSTFQVGSEVAFSVGSLNNGFAQVVANLAQGTTAGMVPPDPHIGVNISADAEFVGDPWTADIDCDLRQVWRQVRSSVGASVSFGFIHISGAQAAQISQDLQKSGACTFKMKEGSLSTDRFGRQILEMTKQMFEEINKSAVGGQGYFKFEPNPEAPPAGGGGGISLFGWGISINASYSSASFTQGIRWNTTVSYSGRALFPVTLGSALAVSCSESTKQFFEDLRDASDPCITQAKVDLFNSRTSAEVKAKAPLYRTLSQRLVSGQIALAEYNQIKRAIDEMVVTDTTLALSNISVNSLQGVRLATSGSVSQAEQVFQVTNAGVSLLPKEELLRFKTVDVLKTLRKLDKQVAKPKP